MINPYKYKTKTQETILLGITHYDELMDWCNDDPERAYHLLDVFFDKNEVLVRKLLTSSIYSYFYAKYILKGPFVLGEKAIITSAHYAYRYAKEVLYSPFPLGEETISKSAHYSYYYAKSILLGRFELGEKAISQDQDYTYLYAKDILKCSPI